MSTLKISSLILGALAVLWGALWLAGRRVAARYRLPRVPRSGTRRENGAPGLTEAGEAHSPVASRE